MLVSMQKNLNKLKLKFKKNLLLGGMYNSTATL